MNKEFIPYEQALELKELDMSKLYTIRKICSNGNGQPIHYFHIDIVANNKKEAINIAKNIPFGWIWIDSFDKSDVKFTEYQ